jgi:hypothetical protein
METGTGRRGSDGGNAALQLRTEQLVQITRRLLPEKIRKYIHMNTFITDRPNVLGTIGRNNQGHFEQIHADVAFHLEPMLTIVYNPEGVYIVLGMVDECEPALTRLLVGIDNLRNRVSHTPALFAEISKNVQTFECEIVA